MTTDWQVLYIIINAVAAFGFMFSMDNYSLASTLPTTTNRKS
jgi:hypothetical protein